MMFLRKSLKIFWLVVILTCSIFGAAAAKSSVIELKNITAYDLNDEILRIETEFKGDLTEEDFSVGTFYNFLTVDFKNAVPGKTSKDKGVKNDAAEFVEKISSNEVKVKQTRIRIKFSNNIGEDSYTVKILPPDKKEKKKFSRLIIDVEKSTLRGSNLNIRGRSVVIDPGHGGSDNGAVGPHGVKEKSVTLAVALKTEKILKNAGAKVTMTRTTDRDVCSSSATHHEELQARIDKAPSNAEVFVSIHCNAFSNPASHGMETYHFHGSKQGMKLARLLNEELETAGGLFNRGVKGANFYVIKYSSCPASLVELAFVTNPKEEKLLADENYQQYLAEAIARGISRFFNE